MSLKYVLYPGFIASKSDGDWHFINESYLAFCYGISLDECMVIPDTAKGRDRDSLIARAKMLQLIPLEPRYRGDYKEHLERLKQSFHY